MTESCGRRSAPPPGLPSATRPQPCGLIVDHGKSQQPQSNEQREEPVDLCNMDEHVDVALAVADPGLELIVCVVPSLGKKGMGDDN